MLILPKKFYNIGPWFQLKERFFFNGTKMIDGLSDNGSWLFNKEKTLHFLGIGAWLFWQVVTLSTCHFVNLMSVNLAF
jgi:hypothetical protein